MGDKIKTVERRINQGGNFVENVHRLWERPLALLNSDLVKWLWLGLLTCAGWVFAYVKNLSVADTAMVGFIIALAGVGTVCLSPKAPHP